VNSIAPFENALDFDNVGLLIGDMKCNVTSILLALDVNKAVIAEAVASRVSLIICHHPPIWQPLKKIVPSNYVWNLIKHDINLIAAHTNLDLARGGVNSCLANALELNNQVPLEIKSCKPCFIVVVFVPIESLPKLKKAMVQAGAGEIGNYQSCSFTCEGVGTFIAGASANPHVGETGEETCVKEVKLEMACKSSNLDKVIAALKSVHPYEEPVFHVFENRGLGEQLNMGVWGELTFPASSLDFLEFVTKKLKVDGCRYFFPKKQEIRRVACCGGQGSSCLGAAVAAGTDVLVTGDVKHNVWYEAERLGLGLIDAGHFATEVLVLDWLKAKIVAHYKKIKCTRAFGDLALERFFCVEGLERN
jgi:dinuclear metal center YbgI/SA1388 family protein